MMNSVKFMQNEKMETPIKRGILEYQIEMKMG